MIKLPAMAKPLILVVESDDRKRSIISSYLDKYRVFEARNFAEAKTIVKVHYLKLRIVISNYFNEEESVHEFIEYVSTISYVPKVLVYSEKLPVKDVVSVLKAGAYDYMVQPLTAEKLQHVVSSSIEAQSHYQEDMDIDLLSHIGLQDKVMNELNITKCHREGKTVNTEDILNIYPNLKHQQSLDINRFQQELFNLSEMNVNKLRKAKILVVEDEEIFRSMICEMLKQTFDLYQAGNGEEALSILKTDQDIDVVLLDIFLPDVTGDELVSHIKSLNKRAEIIILTAFEEVDKAVNSLKSGAFEYLNKPVLKKDLMETVLLALDRRYQQSIFPEFSKKFLINILSDEAKLNMLESHCRQKLIKEETIHMKDIYLFFPDLSKTFIPESLAVPKSVIESNISKFIDDLKKQVVRS